MGVCPGIQAAVTEPLRKAHALNENIIELRQKNASLRLIRELLAAVNVTIGTDTIARLPIDVNGELPLQRPPKRFARRRAAVANATPATSKPRSQRRHRHEHQCRRRVARVHRIRRLSVHALPARGLQTAQPLSHAPVFSTACCAVNVSIDNRQQFLITP